MQGRRGIVWLAAVIGLAIIVSLPIKGRAAESGFFRSPDWRLPIQAAAAPSSLEAQMLGERPAPFSSYQPIIPDSAPGVETDQKSGATLILPHNLQLQVSFLYNRDAPAADPRRRHNPLPLFNYSMDYHLYPNLKVGLSGYLYHPYADPAFSLSRPWGDRVLGVGPGIKYDLGRWSFIFKMQMETGARDRGENVQNWLRVWYAF